MFEILLATCMAADASNCGAGRIEVAGDLI